MRTRIVWVLAATCCLDPSVCTAGTPQSAPPLVRCEDSLQLPLPVQEPISLSAERSGLMEVEEVGQELRIGGSDDIVEIATPPRLGKLSVSVRAGQKILISRERPGAAAGSVRVSLDCKVDANASRARAWAGDVQAFERLIASPVTSDAYVKLSPRLDALRERATPGYQASLADHLRAQALLMSGRSADAAAAFEVARDNWWALGDRERASAALVAQAEDQLRAGSYLEVLKLARALPVAPDSAHYFTVRLENSRCLALNYLARLDESASCYHWTLRALADLGEMLERISTQQDYAQLERDRGDLVHAQVLAEQASTAISAHEWDGVTGPDIPIVRGRVERLIADLAVRRGDVAGGLTHSQRALAHFKDAHHARWQANTLLRIAAIYGQIGAYADADDAVDIALQSLSSRDAPARIAAAELTKADIELAEGNTQAAAEHSGRAEALFASLQMFADAAAADLTTAEAKLGETDDNAAAAILSRLNDVPPALSDRLALDRIELLVQQGKNPPSTTALDRLRPLAEWLRQQAVAARRLQSLGQRSQALRLLERSMAHLVELAWRAGNPVLRSALARQRRRLLDDAVAITLAGGTSADQVQKAWRWLQMSEGVVVPPAGQPPTEANTEFDRALAESLMPVSSAGSDKPRYLNQRLQQRLLDLVAGKQNGTQAQIRTAEETASLDALQRSLPCGTTFVAILAARASYVILAVSADAAQLRVVSQDGAALRRHATALSRSVAAHDNLGAIEDAAEVLSKELLGALDGLPRPDHLLLSAPEPFNGLPWPLLIWPNSGAPLIDTTSTTLVVPAPADSRRGAGSARTLHWLASAFEDASPRDSLPPLRAADAEFASIKAAPGPAAWRIEPAGIPSKAAALAALSDPGGWVHIAGHGSSSAEYLGRSGLWLAAPGESNSRDLLSWMDIVQSGVNAEVVVLNACALASSAQTSLSASIGFADAMLHAGAHDVVAALWPISDTAAGLWASRFYARLPATPGSSDIAEALRESMHSLRETRTFRHPKYWASFVHLARMEPGASSTARACAR